MLLKYYNNNMEKIECHDCKRVLVEGDEYTTYFGSFHKCKKCHQADVTLRNFQPCQIYSRVVGYYQSTQQWNKGKQEEFKDRKVYKVKNKKTT